MSYTRKETIDTDFAIRRNRTFFLPILFISRETEWYPSWYKKEEKKYEGSSVLFSSSSFQSIRVISLSELVSILLIRWILVKISSPFNNEL